MNQHGPAEHEVERAAELLGGRVVDRKTNSLDAAAKRLVGDSEGLPACAVLLGAQVGRPVELLDPVDVEGCDGDPAPLEIECPNSHRRSRRPARAGRPNPPEPHTGG
jgi:hypothetical protein